MKKKKTKNVKIQKKGVKKPEVKPEVKPEAKPENLVRLTVEIEYNLFSELKIECMKRQNVKTLKNGIDKILKSVKSGNYKLLD